jgi:hypothetical protein
MDRVVDKIGRKNNCRVTEIVLAVNFTHFRAAQAHIVEYLDVKHLTAVLRHLV